MAFPNYPATSFEQGVDLAVFSANQLGDVINGSATTEVATVNGNIPTLRKALVDNFYFKSPLQWQAGTSTTVFNQLYYFQSPGQTLSGLYYAPSATTANPVTLGTTPVGDANFVLYSTTGDIKPEPYTSGMIINSFGRLYYSTDTNGVTGTYAYIGNTLPYTTSGTLPENDQTGLWTPTNTPGIWLKVGESLQEKLNEVSNNLISFENDLLSGQGADLVGPGVISRGSDKFSILQGQSGEQFGADITKGIGIQLAEPITGSGLTVNTAKFNYIRIDDDRFNAVDDPIPGTKVDGLLINHKFGGAGTKGGRHAAEFILEQTGLTESTNTDRNYVGCVGFTTSSVGDGGADFASAKGAYFGGNFYGTLTPGAMYTLNVTGAEFNVGIPEGASSNIRTGLQIGGTKAKRGDVIDAGITLGNLGGAVTWRTGIAFGPQNGGAVFGEDSRVLSVDCQKIDRVLSLSSLIEVNHIIYHNLVKLSTKSLLMEDVGSFVSLGSPSTASTPVLQARSSGTGSAYDSRILFSGGTATAGSGNISFNAGLVSFNSTIRPSSDNVYDYGTASLRGRTAYFGTGSINTSDERHKPITENITDALLDAWSEINWVQFKFDDAINLKGEDGARWHFGLIAQRVKEVFENNNIDGFGLGLLCYDEWKNQDAVLDQETGEVIIPALEAGDRYGIRYEEALALEAALQRRTSERLQKTLDDVLLRLSALESN